MLPTQGEGLFHSVDRIVQKLSGLTAVSLQPWQPQLSQFSEFSLHRGNCLGNLQPLNWRFWRKVAHSRSMACREFSLFYSCSTSSQHLVEYSSSVSRTFWILVKTFPCTALHLIPQSDLAATWAWNHNSVPTTVLAHDSSSINVHWIHDLSYFIKEETGSERFK